MKPLTPGLQSAMPGEGAAFFILSRTEADTSRYGSVVDVRLGRSPGAELMLSPECDLLILGADGHKSCDMLYQRVIPEYVKTACYSPLYGSLPIGPAFDIAVAALSIKEGRTFAPPASLIADNGLKDIREMTSIIPGMITCLKLNNIEEFGMISISRN